MYVTDVFQFDDTSLLYNITRNTRRYVNLFAEVIDKLMPPPDAGLDLTTDVLDLIMEQRQELNDRTADEAGMFPPELMRR